MKMQPDECFGPGTYVLCTHPWADVYIRNTLQHRGAAKRRARAEREEGSDPMVEAGATSTRVTHIKHWAECTPHRGYSWSHHWNPILLISIRFPLENKE